MDNVTLLNKLGDKIERDYCDQICDTFPNYAELWANFIGNDGHANPLGYNELTGFIAANRDRINNFYRTFYQTHYTMFFHLVGMYTNMLKYEEEAKKDSQYISYYVLRESEIVFYLHLGIVANMVKKLWELVFNCNEKDVMERLEEYLIHTKHDDRLFGKLKIINDMYIAMRHDLTHFSLLPINIKDNKLLRREFIKGESWVDYHKRTDGLIDIEEQMQDCFAELKKILNELHAYLINELASYYTKENIGNRNMDDFTKGEQLKALAVGISTELNKTVRASGDCISDGERFEVFKAMNPIYSGTPGDSEIVIPSFSSAATRKKKP